MGIPTMPIARDDLRAPATRPLGGRASTDVALVARAMTGDHAAYTILTEASIGRMLGIARLILRDTELAEDAVQEALVAAWRDLSALRDPAKFDAWLRRLLVRACYSEAKRSRRMGRLEGHVRMIDVAEPDQSRAVADRDQLARAFGRLNQEQRALVTLHFYVGLPVAEVAAALDLPLGTVKSRLHRTTEAMRADLDSQARVSDTEKGRR